MDSATSYRLIGLEERLRSLESKVDQILAMLKELKDNATLSKPVQVPPYPWGSFPVGSPNPLPLPTDNTRCSVCGIGSNGPMGYVCTRRDCPSGVVTCQT